MPEDMFKPDGASLSQPSQQELDKVLPAILKRSADKGYVQKQDVEKALSAINSLTLKQVLELIPKKRQLQEPNPDSSWRVHDFDDGFNTAIDHMTQSAERIWGKQ